MNTDDLSARPFDVVGFGLNTLDLIAVIDGFPEPVTKVRFQELDIQGGGIVATAMAACARLGLRTRYVGKVGGDFWSRLALRSLSAEGIDVRHVIRMKGSPGQLGIVLADRSTGERTILFRRPPSYSVRPEEITREAITAGRLLHVDSMDAAAALQAVKWAREASMRITMDGDRFVPASMRCYLAWISWCATRDSCARPPTESGLRRLSRCSPTAAPHASLSRLQQTERRAMRAAGGCVLRASPFRWWTVTARVTSFTGLAPSGS